MTIRRAQHTPRTRTHTDTCSRACTIMCKQQVERVRVRVNSPLLKEVSYPVSFDLKVSNVGISRRERGSLLLKEVSYQVSFDLKVSNVGISR